MRDEVWKECMSGAESRLVLVCARDRYWRAQLASDREFHNCYQLNYCRSGCGKITIAGHSYLVTPGDIFFSNPGEIHQCHTGEKSTLEYTIVNFDWDLQSDKPVMPNHFANLTVLPSQQQWELESILRRVCVEDNAPSEEGSHIAVAFFSIFLMLLMRYFKDVDSPSMPQSQNSQSQRVLEYIERHYDRPVTLSDLARMVGLQRQYFCEKFSSEIGVPPMAMLTKKRVEAARSLLCNTQLSITEIAQRVGYQDVYSFSKRFKAVTGISPKTFREKSSQPSRR